MTKKGVVLSAVALLATVALGAAAASAAPPVPARDAVGTTTNAVESVDYLYGGHRYCWYLDGWHGPGWYRCGYSWRRGLGWGSPVWGWNGWAWSGPRYRRGYVYRNVRPNWYRGERARRWQHHR